MLTASIFKIRYSLIDGANDWDEVRIHTYPNEAQKTTAQEDPNVIQKVQDHLYHLEAGTNRVTSFETSQVFFNSLGGNAPIGYYEACASSEAVTQAGTMDYDLSVLCP